MDQASCLFLGVLALLEDVVVAFVFLELEGLDY